MFTHQTKLPVKFIFASLAVLLFISCRSGGQTHQSNDGSSQDTCNAAAERSVTCWGAKADGTTDNSNAFKAAADWANQGSQTAPRSLYFPSGVYVYSGGLVFTQPVTLSGTTNAVLNYTGKAEAVKFGPDGLTVNNFHYVPYVVDGLAFTGGANMTEGIYFNTFLTQTRVNGTRFLNFGNDSAYSIFYQSQNWYNLVDGVSMWSQRGPHMNGIRTNGVNKDGVTSDNGQSRTIVVNSLLQFNGGTGIYVNAFHSVIDNVTVAGSLKYPIQIGSWGNFAVMDHVYEEALAGTLGCIVFGDATGNRTSATIGNLTVRNSYCNLHNSDFSTKTTYVVPATGNARLRAANFDNNLLSSVSSGAEPVIVQNDVPGQTENRVNGLFILNGPAGQVHVSPDKLHSKGKNITNWEGADGDSTQSKP